ncbi:MAG: sulfotransferase [Gammaproteobacteria bacterium]|nr:MAG: sulfotransferase [Gammaproteobacteria bacterium]
MPTGGQVDTDERSTLMRALADTPGDANLLLRLGRVELAAGRLEQAEDCFRQAMDVDLTADALEGLGITLNRQARFRQSLPYLRQALTMRPGSAQAWNSAGEALGNLGQVSEAAEAFARAVGARGDFAPAHYNLGVAMRTLGRREDAIEALRRAVQLQPDFPEALHALGSLLHTSGNYQAAIGIFRRLTRMRPRDPATHTSLGASCQMLGDLLTARICYEKAVELGPEFADAHSNLGSVYQGLRRSDLADASFRRALKIDPGHDHALAGLAASLDRRGQYQEAYDLLSGRLETGNIELTITAAQILRHMGRSQDASAILEQSFTRSDLNAGARQRLDFNLADAYDDLGQYEEAFTHYRAGNAAKPVRFDRREYCHDVERLLQVFSAEGWSALPRIENPSERLVFVLGMPRSGTSLVEQILACHSRVAGAGELTDLAEAAIELGRSTGARFPDSMLTTTTEKLERAADKFLKRLDSVSKSAVRVVDKTPANHLFVGFIQNLFPNARIVHCVRHPLDTALSNYFQDFAGQGIPFSYDLSDIALYYNEYLRVMAHWRQHSSLRIHEIVYEELVADQEQATRALLAFLDLEWDPACLNFHESDRAVATASHAQVRKPIYQKSVGRYRHYEAHLAPLIDAIDWDAWQDSGFAERVNACLPD